MKVKLLTGTAKAPTRGTDRAVGYDFYSDVDIVLPAMEPYITEDAPVSIQEIEASECVPVAIKTGCAIVLPEGHVGLFRDRSSYGVRGVIVTAGVIDPDYRGEVLVCLANLNPFPISILKGDKLVQMLVMPCRQDQVELILDLPSTERGAGGFGSTGN